MNNTTSNGTDDYYEYWSPLTASEAPLGPTITWFSFGTLLLPTVLGTLMLSFIVVVICRDRTKFSGPYYSYLACICIAEIYSLQYYGTFGCICIAIGECPVPAGFNRVVSSLSQVAWNVEFAADLAIAVDRLVAICFFKHYAHIFTPRTVTLLCALIWFVSFAFAAPHLVWLIPVQFIVWELSIDSEIYNAANNNYSIVQWYGEIGVLVAVGLIYAACIAYLIWRQRQQAGGGGSSASMRRAQRNLLVQALLRMSLMIFVIVFNNTIYYLDIWTMWATAMAVQLMPVNTAAVTLALNGGIREDVVARLSFRCLRKKENDKKKAGTAHIGMASLRRVAPASSTNTTGLRRSTVALFEQANNRQSSSKF